MDYCQVILSSVPTQSPYRQYLSRRKSFRAPNQRSLFDVRLEGKEVITYQVEGDEVVRYRNNLFALFQQIFLPTVLFIGIIIMLGFGVYYLYFTTALHGPNRQYRTGNSIVLVPFAILAVLGWWIYQYVDWANYFFQITHDQILIIERPPLEKRTGDPLFSLKILFLPIMNTMLDWVCSFKVGKVHINVGSKIITLRSVFDHRFVQQDIDHHRNARNAQLQRERSTREAGE